MISRSKKVLPALALVALATGASSCQLDDMAKATADMQQKTSTMAATTGNVSKTSEYTYADLRQGNSSASRMQSLQAMEQASSEEGKILEAALYYKSFEFQLWKDVDWDSEAKRQMLFKDALEQYFLDVERYLPRNGKPDPTSGDEAMKNLDALAATMHELNTNQVLRAQEMGFKAVSILDLVKDGLDARKDVDSGRVRLEDLAPYQQMVLANASDAIFLLQLRANFLAAMVLSKISNIADTGIVGLFEKAGMLLMKWNPLIGELDVAPLVRANEWMTEANRTRDYLLWLGVDPRINSKLLKIYRNMNNPKDLSRSSSKAETDAVQALLGSIDEFRR